MSALGRYEMRDYSVWTAQEVRDEWSRLEREVTATNSTVNGNRNSLISAGPSGNQFWTDWQLFMRAWQAGQLGYQRTSILPVNTSSSGIVVQLRQLADRFNALEARYTQLTGVSAPTQSEDTRGASWWSQVTSNPQAQGLALITTLGIGAVGLVAVAVIVAQVRNIMRPVTRNRRRRRSRQ